MTVQDDPSFSVDQVADLHPERPGQSHDDTQARVLAPALEASRLVLTPGELTEIARKMRDRAERAIKPE